MMAGRTIVFVVSGPEGYGVRSVWSLLVRTLGQSGLHIVIAVFDRSLVDVWRREFPGVDVVYPPFEWRQQEEGKSRLGRIVRSSLSQLKLVSWLYGVVRRHSASGIVLQGPIETLICGLIARLRGIPALWFVPNAISDGRFLDMNKRIYRGLFRHANVIPIANSRFTDSTFGSGNFRRHVVHLGVDTHFFRPSTSDSAVRERFGIPRTATVIGLFARVTPSKGQLDLIKAVARIQEEIHVLFCGGPLEGNYYEALVAETAAQHMQGRIHFAGYQKDLRPYYSACDIITNLLSYPEGFGLTVVEAMACGKPVLAHAAGGPSETILDGRTGWLITGHNPNEITAGLRRAMRDRSRWASMGEAGQRRAESEFSVYQFESKAGDVVWSELARFENCAGSTNGKWFIW